jgi:hypothetical protein
MLTFDVICRRAGGRRHYNQMRQGMAIWRRLDLERIIKRDGYEPGDYAYWAAELGVSRSTICRDVRWLYERGGPW